MGTTCMDFKSHCDERTADALRFMCGLTCGCWNPWGGLYNLAGCLTPCFADRTYELEQVIPCEDVGTGDVAVEGMRALLTGLGYPNHITNEVENCSHNVYGQPVDSSLGLCNPSLSARFGTYLPFCPISCGCADANRSTYLSESCPAACASLPSSSTR